MNNFDACRGITRRHFWDAYQSPLTCVDYPVFSASASGETTDILVEGVYRAAGPTLTASVADGRVTLTWTTIPNGYAAIVYRSDNASGPFVAIVSGVLDQSWVDEPVGGPTFYYRTTIIESNYGESEPSNVVEVTV